jgi:hypothetical protein
MTLFHSNIRSQTKRGLGILILSFLIHLVAIIFFIISMILFSNGESSRTYVRYSNTAFILYLITLLMFLIGFGFMFFYTMEIGKKHSYRVYLASIFMTIAFFIFFIYFFVILSGNFTDFVVGDSDMESRFAYYSLIDSLRDVIMFFFHLFLTLMWILLVFELASKFHKKLLLLYFVISICIYPVAAFISPSYNPYGVGIKYLIESSSIIGSIILIYCYSAIYSRFRKGEINPVPTTFEFPHFFLFRYLNAYSQNTKVK